MSDKLRPELACVEYVNLIKDLGKYGASNMYGMDKMRSELHDEICELFGLEKEETKSVTNHLEDINFNCIRMAEALYKIRNEKAQQS